MNLRLTLPALLLATVCSLNAAPIMETRIGDKEAALKRGWELAKGCPWPQGAKPWLVAATGSMIPVLDEGCYVVVCYKPWSFVKVGDIVCFHRDDFSATHELIYRYKTGEFVSQGCNNKYRDAGVVTEGSYRYTVYAVIRFKEIKPRPSSKKPLKLAN